MKRSYQTFYLGIILISFLLTGMGSCGIFELFGERESSPTKPCVELIPTPTPTLTPTPIPLVLATPTSAPVQPTASPDCSDGPGTAVICNKRVVPDTPFIILPEPRILPTPMPTPVLTPTATPTTGPTAMPTTEPTAMPTTEPTATPTTEPTATPTPIPKIVLYDGGPCDGMIGLGGRDGVNDFCASSPNAPSAYSDYKALISVDTTDSIANMPSYLGVPSNLPIYSTSNNLIASNWADLTGSTINMSLSAAGVLSTSQIWWSGSISDGTSSSATCSAWSINSPTVFGQYGHSDYSDWQWLTQGSLGCDVSSPHVLCIAY